MVRLSHHQDDFFEALLDPNTTNVCFQWLQQEALASPVHNQDVEGVFAFADVVMKAHNLGSKLKLSEKKGSSGLPDLLQNLMLLRDAVVRNRREAVQAREKDLVRKRKRKSTAKPMARSQAKDTVITTVDAMDSSPWARQNAQV